VNLLARLQTLGAAALPEIFALEGLKQPLSANGFRQSKTKVCLFYVGQGSDSADPLTLSFNCGSPFRIRILRHFVMNP